jgi:phosphatidylserine/phosphatidylglycerophosphate/cardiolipin synthase-like enzyme
VGVVVATLLLVLFSTVGCGAALPEHDHGGSEQIESSTLRGYRGTWYQAYFTKPTYPEAPTNRQDGMDEALAADIAQAQQSVALASFDLDLAAIADALLAAHGHGVAVQVTIDGENLADPVVSAVLGHLEDAGVAVFYDRRSAFMHNKVVVIDRRIVWSGSWNLTTNDTFRNNNNMVRIEHEQLAAAYGATLDQIHTGAGGPANARRVQRLPITVSHATVRAMFAPVDPITEKIIEQIDSAQTDVQVLAFAFTSDAIAQALVNARARGVHVRVVMERRNTKGTGSQFAMLRDANIDALADGNCFVMHHKVMVIDGEHTITGSFNFTDAAQEQNDENVLLIHDRSLAALYQGEFERVYDQALNPTDCEE